MIRLKLDLKVMLTSYKGHKLILAIIAEVTISMVTIPIHQCRSKEIGDALIEYVFNRYSIPEYMIMDQGSAHISTLINYLFKKLGIKIKTVAPYKHPSLQAEYGIKSSATILTTHLTGLG